MAGRSTSLVCALLLCSLAFAGFADSGELPDFSLGNVSVDPSWVFRGTPAVVSFELIYSLAVGQIESVAVEITCRRADLEKDCFVERRVIQLNAEGGQAGSFVVETHDFPAGEYEVSIRVDPDDDVREASETNNRAIVRLVVGSPLPDLVPTALSADPRSPIKAGSTVRFSARVANKGAAPAAGFVVVCELDPPGEGSWTPIGSVRVPGLERDSDIVLHFPHEFRETIDSGGGTVPPEGTYGVRVRIDPITDPAAKPSGEVEERDETNNLLVTSISVDTNKQQRPDLRPVSLTLSPSSPLGWLQDATASVVVVNTGGAATAGPVEVAFYYRRVGTDDPGWQPFREPDPALCDPALWVLAVRSPSHERPLSIEEESNTELLEVPIRFAEYEVERSCTVEGGTVNVLPPRILPGEYELKVVVDPNGEEVEQYENNNELIVGFSVVGSELQPESLELSQSSVARGTDVVVRATVRNTGAKTAEAFMVGFFVDANRLDTYYYGGQGLAADDVVTVQGVIETQDLVEGEHVVRVVVDPDNRLFELDKANNTVSVPLKVETLPERKAELLVDRIEFEPASPISPGHPFLVRAAINNAGDLTAEEFNVILRLTKLSDACPASSSGWESVVAGGDSMAEWPMTVTRLEPSETLWLEWTLPGSENGVYGVQIEVDPDDGVAPPAHGQGQVPEQDETNNTTAMSFAVCDTGDSEPPPPPQPNLVCQELTATPTDVDPGASVAIAASITNAGGETASECNIALGWMYPTGYVQHLESVRIGALSPGASIHYTWTIDTTAFPYGPHQAILQLDVGNEVDEGDNEADNECYATIWIGTDGGQVLPDLLPVSVRFDSPDSAIGEDNSVELNQRLYAYVTVRNDGSVRSAPFAISFSTPLGVETEQWTGIGALDQVEVSYPVPTGTAGEFALSIEVDPDNLIQETKEDNNEIPNAYVPEAPSYTVVGPTPPKPEIVVPASGSGSAVRWLAADPSGGSIYAVSIDGRVRGIDPNGSVSELASVGGTVTDVEWSFAGTSYAFLGTTDGSSGKLVRVHLETGAVSGQAEVDDPVIALARGGSGQVYVAVQRGFHKLVLSGAEYEASGLVEVSGEVRDILYDTDRSTIYVLSNTGVHAYGTDLSPLCSLDAAENLVGTPSMLTLAGFGIYIGADAGTGGILYAASHCTVTAGSGNYILVGWRYQRGGSLPGAITSIVIDPRDIDPIYITTDAGSLYSLGFDGTRQWIYEVGTSIRSTLLADKRTGRLFFGDEAGIPHVLTLDGIPVFEINLTDYNAGAIRSTLVITETREKTDFGMRFTRNYYYGTENGAVYRVTSQQ
jgi:hypothetical protein